MWICLKIPIHFQKLQGCYCWSSHDLGAQLYVGLKGEQFQFGGLSNERIIIQYTRDGRFSMTFIFVLL